MQDNQIKEFNNYQEWKGNLNTELTDWETLIKNDGRPWQSDYHERISKNRLLAPFYREKLTMEPDNSCYQILEVGCGAYPMMGTCSDVKMNIIAIDPLAEEYKKLYEKYNIYPENIPIYGCAETLEEQFPINHFDFIYASNCLDHSYNPLLGVMQMCKVLKENGILVLRHHPNEGERCNYQGLHQWDLNIEENNFIIKNKEQKIIVNDLLQDNCKVINVYSDGAEVPFCYVEIIKESNTKFA